MNREKRIATTAVIMVLLVLIVGNALMIYLGQQSWPGQTTDHWTGSAPQPGFKGN